MLRAYVTPTDHSDFDRPRRRRRGPKSPSLAARRLSVSLAARRLRASSAQADSIPCLCFASAAAGEAMNFNTARAASGCVLLADTPPEKIVMVCTAGGSGPTTSMPARLMSSLSC